MTVFKMFLKLINAKRKMLLLYIVIFVGMFVASYQLMGPQMGRSETYENTKVNLAIVDEDDSELSHHLRSYLAQTHTIKDVGTDLKDIKDAMYFADISYAITIPKGFEEAFLAGEALPLQTQKKPDSTSGFMVESSVSTYLQKFQLYHQMNPEASLQAIHEDVNELLHTSANIIMDSNETVSGQAVAMDMHFNFLSYIFLALTIMTGGLIMLQLYHPEVRKRQLVSPVSMLSFNIQLWLAGVLCVVVFWAIFIVEIQVSIGGIFTTRGLLYALNSLLFAFVAMGITLLIGAMIAGRRHGEEIISGCSNVLGLGCSFLGGAFVPQFLLSDQVQLIGSFTPTFWYVKTNDALLNIQEFTFSSLRGVFTNFGVLCLFIFVTFLLALVILKMKASSEDLSE